MVLDAVWTVGQVVLSDWQRPGQKTAREETMFRIHLLPLAALAAVLSYAEPS